MAETGDGMQARVPVADNLTGPPSHRHCKTSMPNHGALLLPWCFLGLTNVNPRAMTNIKTGAGAEHTHRQARLEATTGNGAMFVGGDIEGGITAAEKKKANQKIGLSP